MAPGYQLDDLRILQQKLAEAEAELERQKERQARAEQQFRDLMDTAPVMTWMAGPDALCTHFNKAWLDFRGRSEDDEAGNGWTHGVHPDDRDISVETYLKAFSARQPFRMQFRLQRAGGDYCWVEQNGVPRNENGQFTGFIGTVTDVSDRRRRYFTPDEEAMRMVFGLTERERQVLVLIAEGKSTKAAAEQLGISYKTADSHRSRILEKLRVHETASMVRYAIRAGLIEP
ncbi:MAG TPA: PAS domain S-box protein [Candidatus Acidoferrales bacterium]|nr:PAS domain S-box protein [Candidatus Acidoferrales bacterium]